MKRKISCSKTSLVRRSIEVPTLARRVVLGGIALTLGLAAITAPMCAETTPLCAATVLLPGNLSVYLYDANGTPILTPDAYLNEGGVYTDTGFVGTVEMDGTIADAYNNVVGYVTYSIPN